MRSNTMPYVCMSAVHIWAENISKFCDSKLQSSDLICLWCIRDTLNIKLGNWSLSPKYCVIGLIYDQNDTVYFRFWCVHFYRQRQKVDWLNDKWPNILVLFIVIGMYRWMLLQILYHTWIWLVCVDGNVAVTLNGSNNLILLQFKYSHTIGVDAIFQF